jgi:hypothetical protein
MNEIEKSIQQALLSEGDNTHANKAYLEFIKANFLIPIEKNSSEDAPEVLYAVENNQTFLPVFTSRVYFDNWANQIEDSINLLTLSGVDLLKGVGEDVIVCLNIGSDLYKEFNPAELARMRSMVLKLFK